MAQRWVCSQDVKGGVDRGDLPLDVGHGRRRDLNLIDTSYIRERGLD